MEERRGYSLLDHTKRLLGQDAPAYAVGISLLFGVSTALGIENPFVMRAEHKGLLSQVEDNRAALIRIELASSETLLIEKRKQLIDRPNDFRLLLEVETLDARVKDLRKKVYGQ